MRRAIEDSFPIVEINRLAIPERNAFKPIYQMHKWFARRASCVFRAILLGALKPLPIGPDGKPLKSGAQVIMEEFYKDHTNDPDTNGKIILDPFMGGGTTVVEALRLGCKVIGIDLNPVAWFIVKTEIEPVDLDELRAAFDRLAERKVGWSGRPLRETLLDLYKTECPCDRCGNKYADIVYTLWTRMAVCTNRECPARNGSEGREIPLFSSYIVAFKTPSIRYWRDVHCPSCKKTFDWETDPAALVPDEALMQNDGRTSAGTDRSNARWAYGDKEVRCPWCEKLVTPDPTSAKRAGKTLKPDKKKVSLTVLYCPKCEEVWQWRGELPDVVTCPSCSHEYNPRVGTLPDDYDFICPTCGTKTGILDSLRQLPEDNRRRLRPYAIEGYCPDCDGGDTEEDEEPSLFGDVTKAKRKASGNAHSCVLRKNNGRFFKRISAADLASYQKATARWQQQALKLPSPQQKIPFGYQTVKGNDLPGHGFSYWHHLFNSRQLLGLATMLQSINAETDQIPKEMLLTAFFQLLRNQCMLCFYNPGAQKLEPALSRKDFAPPKMPCENSIWGSKYGRGTWDSIVDKVMEGKSFCWKPADRKYRGLKKDGTADLEDIVSSEVISGTDENASLFCHSSTQLTSHVEQTADYMITDPPYADNVNYSEVADFFYVWLRLALSKTYPSFAPEYTPKAEEVIAQKTRGKSMADFQAGLTEVFRQTGERINPSGLLIFTFHHEANDAWESVLEAVMQAGYVLDAAYPYESDAPKGGSMGAQKIAYDIIHVCRKRTDEESTGKRSWAGIRQDIRRRAREEVKAIEGGRFGNQPLSPADRNIVLIGKCLELFSEHYGKIVDHEGKPVPLCAALEEIRMMVDQLTTEESALPPELEEIDAPTYVYLTCLCDRKEIKSDEVHKATRGITEPSTLMERDLMIKGRAKRGRTYEVKSPLERLDSLKKKFGARMGKQQAELFDEDLIPTISPEDQFIDYVHFLIGLAENGESVMEWLEKFRGRRPQIRAALEYLARRNRVFAEPIRKITGLMDERTLFTTPNKTEVDSA